MVEIKTEKELMEKLNALGIEDEAQIKSHLRLNRA